jgi:hypothetical protein
MGFVQHLHRYNSIFKSLTVAVHTDIYGGFGGWHFVFHTNGHAFEECTYLKAAAGRFCSTYI